MIRKIFVNIYRECKSKPYSCFTIGITLPADNLLHFRKKYFRLVIKMLSTDKIKVLGDNIKANQALHNLDWETAKISAISSGEFEKIWIFDRRRFRI